MVRLLLEDVTLLKDKEIQIQVRLCGGTERTLSVPRPRPGWALSQTDPKVIAQIDRLLDDHIECEIAQWLNAEGFCSGRQQRFHADMISRLRKNYGLKSRYQRLRDAGMLTQEELAEQLGICPVTVRRWRVQGRLIGHAYSARGEHLYERPDANQVPVKHLNQRQSATCSQTCYRGAI